MGEMGVGHSRSKLLTGGSVVPLESLQPPVDVESIDDPIEFGLYLAADVWTPAPLPSS